MDTVAQIEAQLVMRNYEGFLGGGGRLRGRSLICYSFGCKGALTQLLRPDRKVSRV